MLSVVRGKVIHYLVGDATAPQQRPAILAHVVNDVGAWGRGFTAAVSARWPHVEQMYRRAPRRLGEVLLARAEPGLLVANMVAQHGIGTSRRRVDYCVLGACLAHVADAARSLGHPIVCPRIGCGLGGGEWSQIEPLLGSLECDVFVYDLCPSPSRRAGRP